MTAYKKPIPTLDPRDVMDYLRWLANRYDDLAEEWDNTHYPQADDLWDRAISLRDAANVVEGEARRKQVAP